MRSSSGSDMRLRYAVTFCGVQVHFFTGLPKFPQGQGFIAATSITRQG